MTIEMIEMIEEGSDSQERSRVERRGEDRDDLDAVVSTYRHKEGLIDLLGISQLLESIVNCFFVALGERERDKK